MKITLTLELDNPYDLDAEQIENDIRMGEDQIGWIYDYKIVSIDVDYMSENQTGEWIPVICKSDGEHHEWCGYKCSECGYKTERLTTHKFCPNCGKPMKRS